MWKRLLATTLCAFALSPAYAQDEVYELRLAHYLPTTHNMAANVIPEWAKRIEDASDNRIKITIYPAGQLLGVTDIFDGVKGGVADLGWSMPGATPGRFPGMSVMELPFVFQRAEPASQILMELYEDGYMDDEFDGVEVLYLHTHHPGIISSKKKIENLDDLKGQRIRFPSPAVRSLLDAFGAEPIGVPAPETYESLDRGVLDGVAFPYDAMQGLRLGELMQYHVDFPMYVLTFYMIMNEDKFNSLPEDLQQVIRDHSGMDEAMMVGRSWDESEDSSRAFVLDLGNEIIQLSPEEEGRWTERAQGVIQAGIAESAQAGVKAQEMYDYARQRAIELAQ